MADLVTIADLCTAAGTLVLALATFASVRSANRAARVAEESLLVGLRPLVVPSRLQDPPEKFGFQDGHWIHVDGGHGHAETTEEVVYFGMALRNVGSGLAVLHGWRFNPERATGETPRPPVDEFHRLTRDIYIPAGDTGFWQGALRDPAVPEFAAAAEVVAAGRPFTVDLLYGDHEGGQRMISRFTMTPHESGAPLLAVSRHWNLDRADPR